MEFALSHVTKSGVDGGADLTNAREPGTLL